MGEKLDFEQLNSLPKETLVTMLLAMQEQLQQMNSKVDHLMEQIALANQYRYGRRSEKLSEILFADNSDPRHTVP